MGSWTCSSLRCGARLACAPVRALLQTFMRVAVAQAAIREDTVLVSVMAVNNEIGVVQPLAQIGAICRRHNVFFHTDAAQATGKVPLDVNALNVDAMSISGHKVQTLLARQTKLPDPKPPS